MKHRIVFAVLVSVTTSFSMERLLKKNGHLIAEHMNIIELVHATIKNEEERAVLIQFPLNQIKSILGTEIKYPKENILEWLKKEIITQNQVADMQQQVNINNYHSLL